MKKIIYAWNYLEWGGAQVHFLALIKEVKNHFDVLVVLPIGFDDKFLSYLRELDVNYELFNPPADYSSAITISARCEGTIKNSRVKLRCLRFSENAILSVRSFI